MRRLARTIAVACAAFAAAGTARQAPAVPGADPVAEAVGQWRQMRRAEVASAEFLAAKGRLAVALGTMPVTRRLEAATSMMDRDAPPGVNAAAVEQFGRDPFPITDIQRLLWDAQRPYAQRVLLKAYYGFCRAEAKASSLSEETQGQLVAMLAQRIDNLAGTPIHYGEQRLFVHLCSDVLTKFGTSAQYGPALTQALRNYAEKAQKTDCFAAAIPAWLDLIQSPITSIDNFGTAVRALGHWEPLSRLRAAAYLGEYIPNDDKAAQVLLAMLRDPRHEARAAAVQVFAFAKGYRPEDTVPKLLATLTHDSGVIVQEAAAKALIARSEQAAGQVGLLLEALTDPSRPPKRKRTTSILRVLAALVKSATDEQKTLILRIARLRLESSTDGALAALQALGPAAKPAVPDLQALAAKSDRYIADRIERHVLPAIQR